MTLITCIIIAVTFSASVYLLLGGELKEICMGIFLLGHAANLTIVAGSRTPLGRIPPVLGEKGALTGLEVDPLPQALILTAIVIGFAVQAFLLTMLVVTWRRTRSLDVNDLAIEEH
jgi:multicomponent Na+:H+ antiporter subunit C